MITLREFIYDCVFKDVMIKLIEINCDIDEEPTIYREVYYGRISKIPDEFKGYKFDCLRRRDEGYYIWIYK